MVFGTSGRPVFPLLPPYGAHDPSNGRIIALHPDDLTPYMGLRARLSQVWINRWTILILLVLVRVLIAIGDVRHDMANARSEALSACTSVESMGSALASMPHYLAEGVNSLTADAINAPLKVAVTLLNDVLILIPSLIFFWIQIITAEYVCIGTWAADVVLGEVEDSIGNVTQKIEGVISDGISSFESFMDDVESAKKYIENFGGLTGDLISKIPDWDNSSISSLNNWNKTANKFLNDTANSIENIKPLNFSDIMNDLSDLIHKPFDIAISSLNDTLDRHHFDSSQLWTPGAQQLKFCGEDDGFKGINDFFDGVTNIAITARKIFIAVLVVAAVLACIPIAIQEIRGWRHMKERAELVRKEADDPMDVVYRVSRPYTAAFGIKAAGQFSNSRRQTLVRWVVAYATSFPALFVLAIAIAALLSCLCQYIILRAISHTVPELSAEVGAYADKVVSSLTNTSSQWANYTNGNVTALSDSFNGNIGSLIATLTSAIDSLDPLESKIGSVLDDTWDDTIFSSFYHTLRNCTADVADEIKSGLKWAQEHAKINLPTFPSNIFAAGANSALHDGSSDSFLSNPGDVTSDKISEVVTSVIHGLEEGLKFETYIALAILLIWFLIVLIGVARAMFLWWGHDRNRGDGGGHAMEQASAAAPVILQPAPIPPARKAVPETSLAEDPFHDTHGYGNEKLAPPGGSENPFHDAHSYVDEKLKFAGQRTYNTVQSAPDPSLRKSSYVEYDTK
ncbi:hypothetical protein N7470_004546 [Penicillium chermesinum]|nr:hypothetical protein N7470_004546 [Penicillium chermesinum]